MTTNWNNDKTKNVVNEFGTQFSDTIFSATLVAAADTTVAVPLTAAKGAVAATSFNKFMAVISVGTAADCFVALNATAATPVGGTFAATTSELLPAGGKYGKMVKSTDVIHLKSAGTPAVTVTFYAIQE
jgi:hypothetical protein